VYIDIFIKNTDTVFSKKIVMILTEFNVRSHNFKIKPSTLKCTFLNVRNAKNIAT